MTNIASMKIWRISQPVETPLGVPAESRDEGEDRKEGRVNEMKKSRFQIEIP